MPVIVESGQIHRPLDWKPSDELDAIPLCTPEEERARAKQWMDQAAANQRDADYWRDKRAYPAEECVRLQRAAYDVDMQEAWDGCFKGKAMKDLDDRGLPAHVMSWPRPENPERFHAVPDHMLLKNGLTVRAAEEQVSMTKDGNGEPLAENPVKTP